MRVGTADQQRTGKAALDLRKAVENVVKGTLVEEQLRSLPGGAIAAHSSKRFIEQEFSHAGACATRRPARQVVLMWAASLGALGLRRALDFALPPRCGGCGEIVDQVHSFCADCWTRLDFLGNSGCMSCGLPLEATDADLCAICLARPPRIERIRAAVGYDEISRGLVLRLKYGRKIALARTMARYMSSLIAAVPGDALLVPVPLHRGRLWQRGFNQSVLVARELARVTGLPHDPDLLRRVKRTPPLKGLSVVQRRRTVAGAFKVRQGTKPTGRTIILVDDVLTTGSTANACARVLKRAGAERVELVAWSRVVRPSQLAD